MSAFKIGGSPFRSPSGVAGGKRPESKVKPESAAPASKNAYDTASFQTNRLAVMPRMSTVGGPSAQRVPGEAVESLLRDSAAELDDYFTKAYGFDVEA